MSVLLYGSLLAAAGATACAASGASPGELSAGGAVGAGATTTVSGAGRAPVGGTGTGAGGSNGEAGSPPAHTVAACDAVDGAASGSWEEITPPEVSLEPDFATPAGTNFGVHSLVVDPTNTAIVYLGTSAQGIYKSTDCAASWVHINTGNNGSKLDGGRQWTFVIDPVDHDVLYTNAGYGTDNAWKSTNGGVDWELLIDSETVKALQFGGFVHLINMDPTNHEHLIVTPHFACEVGAVNGLPKTSNCLLETTDAGASWKIVDNTPGGFEGGGQWMHDATNWYWSRTYEGLWHTANAGASWEHVYSGGYATIGDFVLPSGKILIGGVFSMLESLDGIAWQTLAGSPNADLITGDAETLFVARGADYHSAPTNSPTTWTQLATPAFPRPDYVLTWDLKYDVDHHLLYSSNSVNGAWRMRTQ